MKNAKELRSHLMHKLSQYDDGDINERQARNISSMAGRIVGITMAQLIQSQMRGEIPNIKFLKE